MYAKLAWRNMWRNPRRTTVILIAVIIGIWAMIFLGSIQRGMNDQMIRTNIATMTGQIQVHRSGYRSDPVVQNSITDVDEVQKNDRRTTAAGLALGVPSPRQRCGVQRQTHPRRRPGRDRSRTGSEGLVHQIGDHGRPLPQARRKKRHRRRKGPCGQVRHRTRQKNSF